MAKIFKSMGVEWEEDSIMMDAYPVKIEKVRFVQGAYDNGQTDGLFLELRLHPENKLHYYGLVGKTAHEFKADSKVNSFENLVERYILGNFNADKSTLQSLMFPQ